MICFSSYYRLTCGIIWHRRKFPWLCFAVLEMTTFEKALLVPQQSPLTSLVLCQDDEYTKAIANVKVLMLSYHWDTMRLIQLAFMFLYCELQCKSKISVWQ